VSPFATVYVSRLNYRSHRMSVLYARRAGTKTTPMQSERVPSVLGLRLRRSVTGLRSRRRSGYPSMLAKFRLTTAPATQTWDLPNAVVGVVTSPLHAQNPVLSPLQRVRLLSSLANPKRLALPSATYRSYAAHPPSGRLYSHLGHIAFPLLFIDRDPIYSTIFLDQSSPSIRLSLLSPPWGRFGRSRHPTTPLAGQLGRGYPDSNPRGSLYGYFPLTPSHLQPGSMNR
jgi:hypothetical protein